jgi:hypothetical protein
MEGLWEKEYLGKGIPHVVGWKIAIGISLGKGRVGNWSLTTYAIFQPLV